MKHLTVPFFALVCLFVVAAVAAASEVPEAAPETAPTETLDLFGPESSTEISLEASDCNPEPTLDLDGEERVLMFSNDCSVGCSTSRCQGVPRGNPCWTGSGWGNCDLYLGYQCSDGTGWDCRCYGAGEHIP